MAYDAEGNWIPDPLPFGSPWANDRSGWTPENIDSIFNAFAKSEAGNVGAQTLAKLRELGVSQDASLDALWNSARASANPNWAGGSPTGISREIWNRAGILPQVDSPALRAAQGREDQQIWQGQQQDDDGFGDLAKLAALAGSIYFGGAGLGLWGGAGAAGAAGAAGGIGAEGWLGNSLFGGLEAAGAAGGGAMDWWDLPSFADSGGWESWVPDANSVYNPVSANDPIGELIRQLDAGKSSADALKAVESSLPGTTRSALEQFLFESGSNASNLLKNGASKLFGGGDSSGAGEFSLSKLLGAVGPGIGGYLASNAQADAYRDIANRQLGEGQWARDMLRQSYADPNAYLQGEGKTFLDDAAKRQAYALSTGGNPIGSGTQQTQMMSDAYARNAGLLGGYRGGLTAAGYGVPYQAGTQAQMNAVGQQGAGWNALGSVASGVNDIFNPKPTAAQTLADLLKQTKVG